MIDIKTKFLGKWYVCLRRGSLTKANSRTKLSMFRTVKWYAFWEWI